MPFLFYHSPYFKLFFGPNTHFTTYWLKEARIQICSAYIQVLWHLQFVTGVEGWFAVSVMALSLPQSPQDTAGQTDCHARFFITKFWIP